jgi:hypothetical protein
MIIDFYRFLWICLKERTNKLGWKQETSGYSCFCCLPKKEKQKQKKFPFCSFLLYVLNFWLEANWIFSPQALPKVEPPLNSIGFWVVVVCTKWVFGFGVDKFGSSGFLVQFWRRYLV